MADVLTAWVEQGGEWQLAGGDLATDEGLLTSVVISLFTDADVPADEQALAGVSERRGWWGDALADVVGDRIGSKLWVLARAKRIQRTLLLAQGYAQDALQWMLDDGVARSVVVTAEWVGADVLGLLVSIQRPDGANAQYRFERFWRGE